MPFQMSGSPPERCAEITEAGVVDHHVETTRLIGRSLDPRLQGSSVGDIERRQVGLATRCLDPCLGLLHGLGVAAHQVDGRAKRAEVFRNRAPMPLDDPVMQTVRP